MDSQHSNLEERLSEAGRQWSGASVAAPGPAFLGAVRRRRTVRRVRAAGIGAVAVLTVAGSVWLARSPSGPGGTDHREIVTNPGSGNGTPGAPERAYVAPSIAHWTNLNRDASLDNPVLPETGSRHGNERAMRLLDSRSAAAFDAAFSGV